MSILGTTDSSSGSKKGNEDGDYRGDGDDGGSDDDDDDGDDSNDDGNGDDGVTNAEDEEEIARQDGAEFAVASDVRLQAWQLRDMLSDESLAPHQPPSPLRALPTITR